MSWMLLSYHELGVKYGWKVYSFWTFSLKLWWFLFQDIVQSTSLDCPVLPNVSYLHYLINLCACGCGAGWYRWRCSVATCQTYVDMQWQTNNDDAPSFTKEATACSSVTGRVSSKSPQKKEQLNPDKVATILGNWAGILYIFFIRIHGYILHEFPKAVSQINVFFL